MVSTKARKRTSAHNKRLGRGQQRNKLSGVKKAADGTKKAVVSVCS